MISSKVTSILVWIPIRQVYFIFPKKIKTKLAYVLLMLKDNLVQVTFFSQGTIPCVSKDGRFIMETPFQVAKAPDGNGGVYSGT